MCGKEGSCFCIPWRCPPVTPPQKGVTFTLEPLKQRAIEVKSAVDPTAFVDAVGDEASGPVYFMVTGWAVTFAGVCFTQEVILSQARLEALPGLLPSLPLVLLVSHYEEDLDWLSHQPHPAIVYEKKSPRDLSGEDTTPCRKGIVVFGKHLGLPRVILACATYRGVGVEADLQSLLSIGLLTGREALCAGECRGGGNSLPQVHRRLLPPTPA